MITRKMLAGASATLIGASMLATTLPAQAEVSHSDGDRKATRVFVKTSMPQKGGKIFYRTKVRNYPNRKTAFWQKKGKNGRWHVIARKRTNQYGVVRYRAWVPRHTGVRWYYKVSTPPTPKFARSFSPVGYTYRY